MGISWNFAELPRWRFGFGAYGISGQGVNYLDTPLDRAFFPMCPPLAAGAFTDLMIMKFAPTVAYQPLPWLSLGFALNKVLDFDQNGRRDDLVLESPHTLGFGVAYEPFPEQLLLEANIKWLNWSGAAGYGDFDWQDQIMVNFGVQYKPIPKLSLRAGYNYGNNPVKEHRGDNGLTPVYLQGQYIPQYYFETFRNIGFPAVTEHHLSVGAGYEITDRFIINVGTSTVSTAKSPPPGPTSRDNRPGCPLRCTPMPWTLGSVCGGQRRAQAGRRLTQKEQGEPWY
jgi:long-chain fatty acid transport protein